MKTYVAVVHTTKTNKVTFRHQNILHIQKREFIAIKDRKKIVLLFWYQTDAHYRSKVWSVF